MFGAFDQRHVDTLKILGRRVVNYRRGVCAGIQGPE